VRRKTGESNLGHFQLRSCVH